MYNLIFIRISGIIISIWYLTGIVSYIYTLRYRSNVTIGDILFSFIAGLGGLVTLHIGLRDIIKFNIFEVVIFKKKEDKDDKQSRENKNNM